MARRIKIPTREMGELMLELVEERDGVWEAEWEPLRGTVYGDQFSRVPRQTVEEAMKRYSRPLVDALGIPPAGALRKIPVPSRECYRRHTCVLYDQKQCFPEAKLMPWCFEPDGIEQETVRQQAAKAIELWRERVYLVVIYGE